MTDKMISVAEVKKIIEQEQNNWKKINGGQMVVSQVEMIRNDAVHQALSTVIDSVESAV